MTEPNRLGRLDPRTPVLVGVGQVSERLDEPGYQRRSPVKLAADAARAALADAGADPGAVAAAIDTVAGVRQFENSFPGARWYMDGARAGIVIGRLDADGRRFVARGEDGDPGLLDLLTTSPEPVGEQDYVRSAEAGNRVTIRPG